MAVFETAVRENKVRWENAEKEEKYLAALSPKQKKQYFANKKKYEKDLYKQNAEDYTDSYILRVTAQEGKE